MLLVLTATLVALLSSGCAAPGFGRPGQLHPRAGDEIMIAGQLFHTGAPVVLWFDPPCYDAYRAEQRFDPNAAAPSKPVSDSLTRYSSFRRHLPAADAAAVREDGWTLEQAQKHIDQFVYHYDVCGTSRQCFKILHDVRGLSVQFMVDVDGTIYQTLDVKERAWHAGQANDRSVGVEIANIGAYPDMKTLDEWYDADGEGPYVTFPTWMAKTGVRTPDFVARPSRPEPVQGKVHGRDLMQYDLTDAQYDSLIKLTATLCKVLPNIAPDCPRDAAGQPRWDVLTDDELAAFKGLIGHYHITTGKIDPGPAFDWERIIAGARALMD